MNDEHQANLVRSVNSEADPFKAAVTIIGLMSAVMSARKGSRAAAQFLRAAADALEDTQI